MKSIQELLIMTEMMLLYSAVTALMAEFVSQLGYN